jgi:hypothetical protein
MIAPESKKLSILSLDTDSVSSSTMHYSSCSDKSVSTNTPLDCCSHKAHRYWMLYLNRKNCPRHGMAPLRCDEGNTGAVKLGV